MEFRCPVCNDPSATYMDVSRHMFGKWKDTRHCTAIEERFRINGFYRTTIHIYEKIKRLSKILEIENQRL